MWTPVSKTESGLSSRRTRGDDCYLTFVKIFIIIVHNHTITIKIV